MEWIETVAALVVGGLLSLAGGWLSDWRLTARERERRREERNDRFFERRDEFQRDTLLQLQNASQKLLRNAGAMLHQDIVAYRTSGVWQKQMLPDNLSEDGLKLNTEAMLLASRVHDEEVRNLTGKLREEIVTVSLAPGEAEAENRMGRSAEIQRELIERTGHLLRQLDHPKF